MFCVSSVLSHVFAIHVYILQLSFCLLWEKDFAPKSSLFNLLYSPQSCSIIEIFYLFFFLFILNDLSIHAARAQGTQWLSWQTLKRGNKCHHGFNPTTTSNLSLSTSSSSSSWWLWELHLNRGESLLSSHWLCSIYESTWWVALDLTQETKGLWTFYGDQTSDI